MIKAVLDTKKYLSQAIKPYGTASSSSAKPGLNAAVKDSLVIMPKNVLDTRYFIGLDLVS